MRNAFVILTVAAVIIGKWEPFLCLVKLVQAPHGNLIDWILLEKNVLALTEKGRRFSVSSLRLSGVSNSPVAGRKKEKNRNK